MNIYTVEVAVSGYCRGYKTFRVEADSEKEAELYFYEGELIEDNIVRDDREAETDEFLKVTLIKNKTVEETTNDSISE